MAAGHAAARSLPALSRPLSPACYCWCHFINKAITLERGGGPRLWDAHKHTHTRAHTHTHTWDRYSVCCRRGGGGAVNPDQLSSEARELYGTSGSSLYGVNRISSGVCPNLRLIHQNLDFQWQQRWTRRHQSTDTHSSV